MSPLAKLRRTALAGVGIASFALVATACSTTPASTSSDGESTTDATVIVAAADPSLSPYNFIGDDGSTWEGINIDLAAALSEELGSTVQFESAGFDTIIPGLASGRYDMALTGMFDTLEREKTVDFVDYLAAKNNFLTKDSYRDIVDMDDLCGVNVGIPGGALEASLLADASTACIDADQPAINVSEFADLDATILALISGRIDVTPNDSAANAYVLASNEDTLKVSGGYLNEGYFAAAFPKDSELTSKVQDAFTAIIEDGTYADILDKWGIADRAIEEATLNGATF
ncbi:ABC transporter substrate-binding protein [Naasia lichenicola]|uniref:ABC transporter substrate-binding protein n=1 Tax=Naasia lichenicola TaxID=2565933 RepID=UPI00130EF6F0|nr:ABC transporter substrate-binding protein [Naasia lichenicola]